MTYWERFDIAREAWLAPRIKLACAIFARWKRLRAAKDYPTADRLLKRAKATGYEFAYLPRSGPEVQLGFRLFWRFGERWSRC